MFADLRLLLNTRSRKETLLALTAAYMLVQLSSLPVAISLPTLADAFNTGIDDTAWIVIIYLMMLGAFVLLGARLGDRYGHARVFFIGIVLSTLGSGFIAISQELWHISVWRAVAGLGSAMVMGNANAILAANFGPRERGRAFAVPIIGARFGTLIGLALFGVLLQFVGWRMVFVTFVPIGVLATVASIPMVRSQATVKSERDDGPIDWLGGILLVAAGVVLVLSGSHLHGGEESYTSADALTYHMPMHLLFVVMLGVFFLVERRMSNPVVDVRHFKQVPFSLSLATNVAYHFSMLATMTLVPVLVEEGFGKPPLYVTIVLLPSQVLGLFMPMVAGWVYDRYQPRLMRPVMMVVIAGGFLVLGTVASDIPFWALPLLMIPISVGTNMFNPINNATVMNSLPLEHRGVASGMMETTREMGHALGATTAAAVLALALPAGISRLSDSAAQGFYIQGFQLSSLMVVFVLCFGALLAYIYRAPDFYKSAVRPAARPASTTGGGD